MDREIIYLPKEQWKGTILPMDYMSDSRYDVRLEESSGSMTAAFVLKKLAQPVMHSGEEYDYTDRLYEDHWEKAFAWGIVEDGTLIAAIETCPEEWSNRLRVTELWVGKEYRRQGIGHRLMSLAKEQARRERRRAIILETQSCNTQAIAFYRKEGFSLIGFDACCYSNRDMERGEVRMEMGYLIPKKRRLAADDIIIRPERREEWFETECMVRRAFWNKYHRGCDEHVLVHMLREDEAYLPSLSRVAVKDGKVIGCIMYSRSRIQGEKESCEVLTFGPLCVDPEWQGCGVGELLVKETMKLAARAGYPGIVIFGEPDYYPRLGFQTCDRFGITTADGKNFSSFMGIELEKDGLAKCRGAFHEAEVFERLTREAAEEYDRKFPVMEKQYYPGQWD